MGQIAVASVVNGLALLLICTLAFSIRLFSVIKYESVIHEFDPYFNYRVAQFLTKEGFYSLWNWFDVRTWYPLGRVIGGTMFMVSDLHPPGTFQPASRLLSLLSSKECSNVAEFQGSVLEE